jgi:hypothetical protein
MDKLYHYVYETRFDDGYYYRGLHSTTDLHDGYAGSGLYVLAKLKALHPHTTSIIKMFNTRDEAALYEKQYIADLFDTDPYCLNACEGGDTVQSNIGRKFSKTTKERMSIAHKGKSLSKEHKAAVSASKKGIPMAKVACNVCNKVVAANTVNRWHNKNCGIRIKGHNVSIPHSTGKRTSV